MTVETFLKVFRFDNAICSEIKTPYTAEIDIPCYAIEEVINEPGNKKYNYYSYNNNTGSYNMRRLYWSEGIFTNYLYHQKQEELKRMLNAGTLYKTIVQQVVTADKIIDDTVKKLENNDNEIQLAKLNNDTDKYRKLLNNLRLITREEVYKNMIFVWGA